MSINWEKSADINSVSVETLKTWCVNHPGSHTKIVSTCDDCGHSRTVEYRAYRDLCISCCQKTVWLYDDLYNQPTYVLKRLFLYMDGILYSRSRVSKEYGPGHKYSSVDGHGYTQFKYNSQTYKVHRIIYKMFNGYIPVFLDHVNRDRSDNRIENLRAATPSENACNKTVTCGKSQFKGVKPNYNKWEANITKAGERYYIGLYDTENEAAEAYNTRATELHGKYACLNVLTED